jgi:hypothetical protein
MGEARREMERDSKLGYGFLLTGAAMPYLIEHLFGPASALIVTVICATAGVCFLWAGHNHRNPNDPPISVKRKACTAVLAIAVIVAVCESSWHIYAQHHSDIHEKPADGITPQTIIQNSIDSSCSNLVAGSAAQIKCDAEEKNRHAQHP